MSIGSTRDDSDDWESSETNPSSASNLGIGEWMLDHGAIALPLPRYPNGPIYDQYMDRMVQYMESLHCQTNSLASMVGSIILVSLTRYTLMSSQIHINEHLDIPALILIICHAAWLRDYKCEGSNFWTLPWFHIAQWIVRESSSTSCLHMEYM